MNEQEKARYNEIKEQLKNCINHDYKLPSIIPIPLEGSVLYKQIAVEIKTEAGLEIAKTNSAENVQTPNVGVIIAVGPKVPDYLVPKLTAYFNQNNDLEYFVGGQFYKSCHYHDVLFGLPIGTFTSIDNISDKQVEKERIIARDEAYNKKRIIIDLNNKDKSIN